MSHAVVRGEPQQAQLYLDSILDEILVAKGKPTAQRELVSLPQILFHCLKNNPRNLFMINGATGEQVTNEEILKQSVSVARSLISKGARGKTITLIMRNHQRMNAAYLAALFADTLPFLQDPSTTVFELVHFLKLIEPSIVFCDEEHEGKLRQALENNPDINPEVVVLQEERHLEEFTKGSSDDIESFDVPDKDPKAPLMLLPTSGSTGLPKAAIMTSRGLVAQLPGIWLEYSQFPTPTALMMVLTSLQWVTFTMTATSGILFQVPRVISPRPITVDHVKEMLLTCRPTWTFFGPPFAKLLLPEVTSEHFSSLETVIVLGAASTVELKTALREKLPSGCQLCDGYGTTETHGYIAVTDRAAPITSNGRVGNIYQYKVMDENGKEVGPGQIGELYVKGISCIEGYFNSDGAAYEESFADGWFHTGDQFHIDGDERISFIQRIKFNFKVDGCHVAPEEVERIIGAVPGVQECVVVKSERGAAAGVVVSRGAIVSREDIHAVVDANLSEHKRLRGGIAFVTSLPHTHSGKLQRRECQDIINKLIKSGDCF